jgi:hypothetical protein
MERVNEDLYELAPTQAQIDWCRKWIEEFGNPRKTFPTNYTSYGLKHYVEAWIRRTNQNGVYIPSSAFVEACKQEGIAVKHAAGRHQDVYLVALGIGPWNKARWV